jgi:hypothetical protein
MTSRTAHWAELYSQGLSLRAVAERVGVTHKAVLYAFREEGVERRPRSQAHNVPPRRKCWPVDYCPKCGEERPMNPKDGWCWSCSMVAQSSLRTAVSTPHGGF